MADELNGVRVVILAADGVEQVELEQSREAVTRAGASVTLLSVREGPIQAMNHDIDKGATFEVDGAVCGASPGDLDALILPGGACGGTLGSTRTSSSVGRSAASARSKAGPGSRGLSTLMPCRPRLVAKAA
jgi:putative intracellular protease/amidase